MKEGVECTLRTTAGAFPTGQHTEKALGKEPSGVGVEQEINGSKRDEHCCRQYCFMFLLQLHVLLVMI